MSRFEHAFHLAIGPQPVAADALRALHAALIARTPEIAPGDPWRLGLLAAERDYLAGQVLALEYEADPTENLDMSIGWLLLAAHAGDEDPHVATLAACRLADRIERRFDQTPPREIRRNRVLQAADDWRCWTGSAESVPIRQNPAREHGLAA
ncbi:MAG: hypothetical protein JWO51_4419 [Rhodospirillales bacterium]|nr:hypothetical protein [Rhodospirillales bacterium]